MINGDQDLPTIEHGIPPPPRRPRTGLTALLRQLEPGDSVLLPITPWRAYGLAYRVLGKGNFQSKKEHGGTRVWRVC